MDLNTKVVSTVSSFNCRCLQISPGMFRLGKGGGGGGAGMFIIGGGGGIGAKTSSFFTSPFSFSSISGSVCVSMDMSSGALGNSIASTSITVALSTIRFSVILIGDVSI